ncbi:MAG: serine hydroxymethyltransferase [Chloroflexi bacterium]|nr:serine hydroxymethyltransferase [Chloroflexota bacterium]
MTVQSGVRDYLFRGALADIDPDVSDLIRHETARQARYLIMIPSESTVPHAVREALSSAFHNIYAEGYPLDASRQLTEDEILDYGARLTEYRRIADERYYKGTEYADIIESLARRRAAELFATEHYGPDKLFVNVQPLSGAPANNAVYSALLTVGDTVMGMDLIQGGHLTHGSPVNRSGKQYNIVSYGIDPETEQIDYDAMRALALQHRPKMIIGGYSSYPHVPDWARYRAIADEVGAFLLADVAHVAGLIAAGAYPNPVGIADVVSFTTHKTLGGPRGAVIITHKKALATKIDRGVFPGEQGGPHINAMAALAVALKLARTEQFVSLQQQTVRNAVTLADRLRERGLRIPFGGTTTHLLNVDCKSVVGPDGTPLSGDMAARILDLCGVVCNRQTIPGDTSALRPSGIRLGTPWITQRGFGDAETLALADIIADVLLACVPFSYSGRKRDITRASIDFDVLQTARVRVRELAASVGIDTDAVADDYPHFAYLDTVSDDPQRIIVQGEHAANFLNGALTSDIVALEIGASQPTRIFDLQGRELAQGHVTRTSSTEYALELSGQVGRAVTWLRSLSDAFVIIDPEDVAARLPGPVEVTVDGRVTARAPLSEGEGFAAKPFYVGQRAHAVSAAAPQNVFTWSPAESSELLTTPLHALHKQLGARMTPFAGYDMPVWYTSVKEEHAAVRSSAGIFDVTHMGVFDVRGPGAAAFLDAVTTNDVPGLAVGESHYTYFLDVHGIPLDDLMIYRLADQHYLVVVNASNNDKVWAWLNAAQRGDVVIDPEVPQRRLPGPQVAVLRDLRDPSSGADQRVDVALQGPISLNILQAMQSDDATKARLKALAWAGVTHATLDGFDLIVSRTGYTMERVAYELFVHPDQAAALFERLIALGATPCGLASRDSLRTEGGLPLYGHELEGPQNLTPGDAGFANYVKVWKPFFVGKAASAKREQTRDAEVVRFGLAKGSRQAHQGDPVVDPRGKVIGLVTSCAIDSQGTYTGLAYVKSDYTAEGTELAIYCGSDRLSSVNLSGLSIGGRAVAPEKAAVLSRFYKATTKK